MTPEIREIAAQPAIVERAVTDAEGIADAVDRCFPALFGRLERANLAPAAAPYIRYLQTGERFELELGVPVPEGVHDTTLPAGRVAVLRHLGPFQGLRDSFEELSRWVEERGEEPSGPHWEAYVTDPSAEPDSSKWITDIYLPLRD